MKIADESQVRYSKVFFRLWVLALWLLLFSSFSVCAAESEPYIDLDLTVSQRNFRDATATWSSRCVFGKEKWLIESHFSHNAVEYFYCDATNVYETMQLTYIPTDLPSLAERFKSPSLTGQTNLPKATDPMVLSIIPGLHPLSHTGANLPWLAYCSGSYLRSTNQLIPLLAAVVRHDPSSFAFEHQQEVFSDDFGLPQKLSLICSAKLFAKSSLDPRLLRTDERVGTARVSGDLGVRIVDGMLAARYTVISVTNIAERTIPTAFTYEQFQLGTNRLVPFLIATGMAANIHLVQEPQSFISATQSYTVVDHRFRSRERIVDAILYPITNGVVLPSSDSRLQSLFKRAEMRAVVDPVTKPRYGIYLLLFAFAAGPAMVFVNWYKNKKHRRI